MFLISPLKVSQRDTVFQGNKNGVHGVSSFIKPKLVWNQIRQITRHFVTVMFYCVVTLSHQSIGHVLITFIDIRMTGWYYGQKRETDVCEENRFLSVSIGYTIRVCAVPALPLIGLPPAMLGSSYRDCTPLCPPPPPQPSDGTIEFEHKAVPHTAWPNVWFLFYISKHPLFLHV
jgi:hypothetical protein